VGPERTRSSSLNARRRLGGAGNSGIGVEVRRFIERFGIDDSDDGGGARPGPARCSAVLPATAPVLRSPLASRLAQGLLVDAGAWDPRLLAVAGALMIATAALAAFVPARRALAVEDRRGE